MTAVSRGELLPDWEQKAPSEAEVALRDAVQRIALAHRDHGYHRITAWCSAPDLWWRGEGQTHPKDR